MASVSRTAFPLMVSLRLRGTSSTPWDIHSRARSIRPAGGCRRFLLRASRLLVHHRAVVVQACAEPPWLVRMVLRRVGRQFNADTRRGRNEQRAETVVCK